MYLKQRKGISSAIDKFIHKNGDFSQNRGMKKQKVGVKSAILKKQSFVSGVMILFVAGVVAKILGAIYRIPLTWLLGAEGLGMYQLVYPLFSLILVLSSTGMPTAISRVTAKYLESGEVRFAKIVLKESLKLLLLIGTIFAVLLAGCSTLIASLQGNINLYICYLGLVPAVILVSVLSALRGYFQGCSNMLPTATSQIIEQGGKLIFGLLCGYFFLPLGVEFGTFGALVGVGVSELLAVVVMLVFFKISAVSGYNSAQNELHSTMHSTDSSESLTNMLAPNFTLSTSSKEAGIKKEIERNIKKQIIKNVIPITLTNAILPSVLFVESVFVVMLLSVSGLGTTTATTLWGINSGVVGSLVNMPIVLTQAVAIAIVPFVATLHETSKIQARYNQATGIALALCVPIFVVFVLLGEAIISLLYQNSLNASEILLASKILLVMSASVIFGSLLQTQNNMLQGLGYGKITARNMLISAVIQVALFVLLTLSSLNILGYVISCVAFYMTAYVLNYIFIRYRLRVKLNLGSCLPSFWGGLLLALYIINIKLLISNEIMLLLFASFGGGVLYLFSFWVWGGAEKLGLFIRRKNKV